MKSDTNIIHAGEVKPLAGDPVVQPIFQSSTYLYGGETQYDKLKYIRLNNTPNHEVLNQKLACLEQTEASVVTGSGMAAITTALLALTRPGDHVLAQECLYGGTLHFFQDYFAHLGREISYYRSEDPQELKRKLSDRTVILYVESISNPLMGVPDFEGLIRFAKEHGLVTVIDNTFPSPVNFVPAKLGFDVVLHSATKYLNGHTDIVGGFVAGSKEHIHSVVSLLNCLGGSMDPHTCFLLSRGMKTLGVRVRQQNKNAMTLAKYLATAPKVKKLNYPGLETDPNFSRAKKYFDGFGAMLSFEYDGTVTEADAFLSRLKIPYLAPSLGGVETLVTRPCTTSHASIPKSERQRLGISDTLVRVSVGLEAAEDLVEDFTQALT